MLVRSSLRILGAAVAVILLASCGPPTLDEIENRSFSNVSDFEDAVSCSDHFRVFPHWAGEAPVVQTEDEVMEMANSLLDASQPGVEVAVKQEKSGCLSTAKVSSSPRWNLRGASIGRMLGILIHAYRQSGAELRRRRPR